MPLFNNFPSLRRGHFERMRTGINLLDQVGGEGGGSIPTCDSAGVHERGIPTT